MSSVAGNPVATATGCDGSIPATPISPAGLRRLVLASTIGTAVENYDFFIYAYTAPIVFDLVFFPKLDPIAGLVAVYATFAVGFFARPFGGLIFGHFSDRIGRKHILMLTLGIMGVASILIGCLPGYPTIGIAAPILLVALRFLQGFALGGEYMSAVALNLESAPSERRGFFASWVNAAGPIGVILAAGVISLVTYMVSRESFVDWVWRIPFLLSFVLLIIGTYIRLQVEESAVFQAARAEKKIAKVPVLVVLKSCKAATVSAILVNAVHSSFNYICSVFVLGYAVKQLGVSQTGVTTGMLVANIVAVVIVPVYAHFSDRVGRRPFILAGIIAMAIWFPFYFQLIQHKDVLLLILGLTVAIGLLHPLVFAPEAAFTAELFPTAVRVTGGSLGKQIGVILGGGLAPLIATSLMSQGGGNFGPVILYFEAIAALAFIGVLLTPENYKKAL